MSITPESILAKDQSEYAQQVVLFCWAATSQIPDIDLMFAIPNGEKRDKATGGRLKAAGVKPGVPDIFWPVSARLFNGLFIEMKVGKNLPSKDQQKYLDRLSLRGYCVKVCYSWLEARKAIEWYNNLRY